MKFGTLFLSLFVAGILSAQTAPVNHPRGAAGQHRLQRLSAELNLTADQQAQAKAIFRDSGQQRRALAPQLQQQRAAMTAAVKSGNQDQINQVIQQGTQLRTQVAQIRAASMAKFYAMLTPDQKATMDQKMSSHAKPMKRRG